MILLRARVARFASVVLAIFGTIAAAASVCVMLLLPLLLLPPKRLSVPSLETSWQMEKNLHKKTFWKKNKQKLREKNFKEINKMSNLPANFVTIDRLKSLHWNALTPLKNARLSGVDNLLDRIVDFQVEKSQISVFVDPQGSIINLELPVTVGQLLERVKQCVQNSDDCVVWDGLQRMEHTEINKQQWRLLGSDEPMPDYVVLLEE